MNIYKYLLSLIFCFSQILAAEEKDYEIDKSHFSLGFLVEHAGYARTLGMFKNISGTFKYDDEKNIVSDINIIIDTNSVFTNHDKRDAHLRSPDFLDTKKYPEMIFYSKKNNLNDIPNKIHGELMLLGIKKPLILEVSINKIDTYPFRVGLTKPMVMGVSATANFNRSDFGMNYAIKKNLVGDNIELIIEFEARQK